MSTHMPGFLLFLRFFALFCIGQYISHQQHKSQSLQSSQGGLGGGGVLFYVLIQVWTVQYWTSKIYLLLSMYITVPVLKALRCEALPLTARCPTTVQV